MGRIMNYYERHLGDYAKKTLHLSMIEHGAYNILLDIYYDTERGIPADKAYRLARARSKEEKAAVDFVLGEFFELIDGSWVNHRTEEEIAKYNDGEPEREIKKANESNRLKRHREERSDLFMKLTAAGQHAPWNINISELRAMVKKLTQNAPETGGTTLPATAPATAPATPATATQTPDTRHQTPEEERSKASASVAEPPPTPEPVAARSLPDPDVLASATDAGALCLRLRKAGITGVNPSHARLHALLDAGLSPDEIGSIAEEPGARGKGMSWVLAAAEGRRRDAANVRPLPRGSPRSEEHTSEL
jgi:uncharacterized protein YdaU (DUF1376 family)